MDNKLKIKLLDYWIENPRMITRVPSNLKIRREDLLYFISEIKDPGDLSVLTEYKRKLEEHERNSPNFKIKYEIIRQIIIVVTSFFVGFILGKLLG